MSQINLCSDGNIRLCADGNIKLGCTCDYSGLPTTYALSLAAGGASVSGKRWTWPAQTATLTQDAFADGVWSTTATLTYTEIGLLGSITKYDGTVTIDQYCPSPVTMRFNITPTPTNATFASLAATSPPGTYSDGSVVS